MRIYIYSKVLIIIYLVLFRIFAETLFHSFALHFYFVNTFGARERSEIGCLHILLIVLSLVFPSPSSLVYSPLNVSQMTAYMRLKLSNVKRCLNVISMYLKLLQSFLKKQCQHSHLLSILLNVVTYKTAPSSALVKNFLKLRN